MARWIILGFALLPACGGIAVDQVGAELECRPTLIAQYPTQVDCTMLWIEKPSGETWLSTSDPCSRSLCLVVPPETPVYRFANTATPEWDQVHSKWAACDAVCP